MKFLWNAVRTAVSFPQFFVLETLFCLHETGRKRRKIVAFKEHRYIGFGFALFVYIYISISILFQDLEHTAVTVLVYSVAFSFLLLKQENQEF